VIVSIGSGGDIYVDYGEDPDKPVSEEILVTRVAALLKYQPGIQFLVKGDRGVAYGRVVEVMALLQGAGVDSVGLITEPPLG
jgi:biopolymer transport protein TolR